MAADSLAGVRKQPLSVRFSIVEASLLLFVRREVKAECHNFSRCVSSTEEIIGSGCFYDEVTFRRPPRPKINAGRGWRPAGPRNFLPPRRITRCARREAQPQWPPPS